MIHNSSNNNFIQHSTNPSIANDSHDQSQIKEDEVEYFRHRHLNDVRHILALRITQSTKVALTAPFDQTVPGCYSNAEAGLPTAIGSGHKTKPEREKSPQIINRHFLIANGFRESLKQDPGHVARASSSMVAALKSVNDQDNEKSVAGDSVNLKTKGRTAAKYVSYLDSTSTNTHSYTAESSALVHLSQDDFVGELFRFGEGSKLLTGCSLLDDDIDDDDEDDDDNDDGDKSGEENEYNVVVSFPNKTYVRYTLLNKDTLNSNNGSSHFAAQHQESDLVITYYSVTKDATIARPQETRSRGFFVVKKRPHECCQVTLTAEIITSSALHIIKIIKSAVMIVRTAYDVFYRGEEVDDSVAKAFVDSIPFAPALTSQEARCLASTTEIMNEGIFKRVWTGETTIDAYEVFTNKDSSLGRVNKCVATIHLSAEWLLALRFVYNSYADMRSNKSKNKDLPRYGYDVPNSRSRLAGGLVNFRSVFNRRLNHVFVWDKVENYHNRENVAYVLAILPQSEFILPDGVEPNIPPITKALIQAITRGFMSFEALAPNISRVTLIQWTDFGGSIPVQISDLVQGYALNFVRALQKKNARKKAVVDAERRDHFASKLRAVLPNALNEEQLGIVATAQALEQKYMDSPVVSAKLHSPSYFAPTQVKYVAPKIGERSVGTGQTSSVLDVSAEVAVAKIVRNVSRDGFPTRFQVEDRGLFDSTYVYIKKNPSLTREFLFRVIAHKHDADADVDADADAENDSSHSSSYSVSVVSVPDKVVDYGIKIKSVRAHTIALYTVTPVNNDQCLVVMTQKIDAGGFVSNFTFGAKDIGTALSALSFLRLALHRDAEVDSLERRLVNEVMEKYDAKNHEMVYTEDDKALVARVSERFLQLSERDVKMDVVNKNQSSDALIDTSSFLARDGNISFLSEFVVDSSVEEVVAFVFCLNSRFLSEAFHKEGVENIDIEEVSPHRQIFKSIIKHSSKTKEIGHNNPLEFECTMAWKRGEGEGEGGYYDIVVEPFGDLPPAQMRTKSSPSKMYKVRMPSFELPQIKASRVLPLAMVRANPVSKREKRSIRVAESKRWSYLRFERVVGDGEGIEGVRIPQTSVKFYSQLRLDASFPLENANALSRRQHKASAKRLRKYFDRSADSDQVARDRFVGLVEANGAGEYTTEEDAMVARAIKRLANFKVNSKMKEVKAGSPLSVNRIGNTEGETMFGLSVTTIRASPLEILAFLWDFESRHNASKDLINKRVVEVANEHNRLGYMEFVTFKVFKNRDFLFRTLWKRLDVVSNGGNDKKMFVFIAESVEHKSFPLAKDSGRGNTPIRALYTATVRLTQTSERETKVEHLLRIGLLGETLDKSIVFIMKKVSLITLKFQLRRTVAMQQYFQGLVKLKDLDEKDGSEIGETLFLCRRKKVTKSVELSAEKVFRRHLALVELNKEYDFFEPMIIYITAIDLRITDLASLSTGNFDKRTKLEVLSKHDGKKLARFLRQMILTSANQGVAVQRFQESVAMSKFIKTRPFVRSMLTTMCDRIITERTLDKVFQSVKKTVSSLADVVSDVAITVVYLGEGGTETANALMIIIAASLFMQLCLCIVNHYRNWRIMLREMLYTVLFIRGGVLHMRMLTKTEAEGHEAYFDAITEALAYRGLEIVLESIPGAFIQLSAILTDSDSISPLKYFSLFVSVSIVSISVSSMDYSKDADFKNRSQLSRFYGFVPGQGFRNVAVVNLMRVICLTQFCIRIGFCSLMGARSIPLLLVLLVGEFAVYMAIKVVRSDVRYWFPVSQIPSVALSLILRLLVFESTAATSLLQGRHPYELGGIGWMLCHVVTHTELLYVSFVLDIPSVTWASNDIRLISTISVVTWWVAFSLMLMFGEAKYRHTFFSTHNSLRYLKFVFESGGDETKARFITNHRSYWEWFRPDIQEWLNANWDRWEHEIATKDDNAFFTSTWKRTIQRLNLMPDGVDKISDVNDLVVSTMEST